MAFPTLYYAHVHCGSPRGRGSRHRLSTGPFLQGKAINIFAKSVPWNCLASSPLGTGGPLKGFQQEDDANLIFICFLTSCPLWHTERKPSSFMVHWDEGTRLLLTAMSAWALGAHVLLAAPRARVLVLTHLQPPSKRRVEQERSAG